MRLLLPPSSIPCGLVRLNCLAWGLTLRLLIRKMWPWCSRFLIATQPSILYACLHATPPPPPRSPISLNTSTQSPLVELPHICLMLSGFKSNVSPKVRLVKPSLLAFTACFCSLWGMDCYTPATVAAGGRWERCDPYLALSYSCFQVTALDAQSGFYHIIWYSILSVIWKYPC